VRIRVVAAVFLFAATASAQPRDVVPPRPLTHVDAVYPDSALARRAHGDVMLDVVIGPDGAVKNVVVRQSAGEDLDAAAIAAAKQWTFAPATREGRPVTAIVSMPFHFVPPVVTTTPTQTLAPPPPRVEPHPATPEEPDEVHVIGRAKPPSRGPSEFDVHVGELARVPRQNASDLLKVAAPGLVLTNEGGEGHAEQVYLRGFDARDGQDIELTVGGVPINESGNIHGNGYGDTHFIIPELVESLRVIEGPYDPKQGNYSVAGSAAYELGLDKRGMLAKLTVGSFDTQRMLLAWGPRGESRHTFAGAEVGRSDGFGQNRDSQRASAMGQYEGRIGERGTWRLFAQGYATHFHTGGVIREDDYDAGRIGFYDSYDVTSYAHQATRQGGDTSRFTIASDIETRTGDTLLKQQIFVAQKDMRLVENFTGFLLDVPQSGQAPHAQRGDSVDLTSSGTMVGARGSARFEGHALEHTQALEVGYLARGDRVRGGEKRLAADTGLPYATDTDLSSNLGNIGLYADADLRPLAWLDIRGGGRTDLFTYDVTDETTNNHMSTSSLSAVPRGSVLAGPFEHFSFAVSAGQSVRSVDPVDVRQDDRTPLARVTSYETGVTYARNVRNVAIQARSIFFETDLDHDIVFDTTQARNVLGPGSTRRGWVGAARFIGGFFDESASLTLVRPIADDTHQHVLYVPDVVARSDTALFAPMPFSIAESRVDGSIGAGVSYVGPRHLPDNQKSDDIFTIDGSATLHWTHYEVGFLATNLLNARYRLSEFNYASDFRSQPSTPTTPMRHFTAGAPRGLFATFGVEFGGP
jgi:TonB family protein